MGRDETSSRDDVVLVYGEDERSGGLKVLRKRGEKVEAGLVKPAESGKPLFGDLVRLKPRRAFPLLCDVEVLYEFQKSGPSDEQRPEPRAQRGRSGPAWVTSEAYRRGYDRIFGPRPDPDDPDVQ